MYSQEEVKAKIQKIIDDFKSNYNKYEQQKEANIETKLVEPLFEALGWSSADFDKRESARRQEKIILLSNKIISLKKQLRLFGSKNTSETAKLKEQIKQVDDEIDELVYNLYNITKEEKKMIEDLLNM